MDKLIESMSNINVRKNDGYLFIKRDEIYVPIMKTILLITKRSFYSLPLLDEIVLRLINEGIQEIDELVNILGIDRKLLEVTLADLSVKDVIYCTTNRCSLLAKGKQALRELRTVQRKKDTVKNVYLDPINRKIILEHENYQFVDNGKKLSEIGYAECYDFRKALSIIQRTMPECSRDKVVQVKTEYYLSLVFDEKYIITGVPKDIVIMDSNTHIHKVEFYLQVM